MHRIGDRSGWKPDWPDTALEMIPFGKAKTLRDGQDLTVVTFGRLARVAMKAADDLREAEGISAELIDLRSLHPYDWTAIVESVRKTGRVLYLNEDTEITNFGEHLIRRTCYEMFTELRVSPRLHAGAHVPGVGLADALEDASVPTLESTTEAIRELAGAPEVGRSTRDVPKIVRRAPTIDVTLDRDALDARVLAREIFGRTARYH